MMEPNDRAWFRRNPHRRYRLRPPTAQEMAQLQPGSDVHLTRVIRGVAPRCATTIGTIGVPEDTDAQAAELLLDGAALLGGVTKQ